MHSSDRAQISVLKETVLSGGIGRKWGLQLIFEVWRIWRRLRSLSNIDYSVVVKLRAPKLHNSKNRAFNPLPSGTHYVHCLEPQI